MTIFNEINQKLEGNKLAQVNNSDQSLLNNGTAQIQAAVNQLKEELEGDGWLTKHNLSEQFEEVENFIETVPKEFKDSLIAASQRQLLNQRQQVKAIASQLQSCSELDQLLNVTVTQVREILQCDRTLIYRFGAAGEKGTVVAESLKRGWTPALNENLPTLTFGLDQPEEYLQGEVVVADINHATITPYQRQLLEKFQVQASVTVPIVVDAQIWGLLVVHNCAEARQWQETEINLIDQISNQLTITLQQLEFRSQIQQQIEKERAVGKVIDKIRSSLDQDAIFKTITQEIRNLLRVDRVAVYQFAPDWSGEFIVESVGGNWTKLVGPGIKTVWADTHLQETQGGRYRYHETFVVDDVYKAGHSPCHVDILEQFEVKAYVIVPIFVGEQLWGLLGVYQNSAPRHWQQSQVKWLNQIAGQLWVALKQSENLKQMQGQSEQLIKATERERAAAKVIDRLRQSLDIDTIFKTTTRDVRELLKVDRVGVYRFNDDWSGEFVLESVGAEWTPLLQKSANLEGLQANQSNCHAVQNLGLGKRRLADSYLQETEGGRFREKGTFAVEDIYKAGFSPCYMEVLEESQVKAYAIVPVYQGEKLWGLLGAYQNSGTRKWEEAEVALLAQIGDQLGVALQQAEYLQQLQTQSAKLAEASERDRTLTKVINRIRQTFDLDTIFKTTTLEVRNLIKVDRVAIYKFRPDYFGDFIAESEAPGEPKLAGLDRLIAWEDPYLNEHKGGRFRNNEVLVVDDVYNGGLTDCHVEALENFHVKACVVVAIFKGQELWGLLSAFQNKETRHWEEYEVELMLQVAAQIGVAIQQAEYLQQLKAQSAKLAEASERDRTLTKVINRIRQTFDLDTIFKTTTLEVRNLIKVDRIAIYKFRPDYFGDFIAESEAPGEPKLAGLDRLIAWEDPYLNEHQGGRFRNNEVLVVDDVFNGGLTDCHVEALENFHVKACVVVAIFKGKELWGLLSAFQNKETRHWEEYEVELMLQVAAQIGVAIQQSEYLQQLQTQSAKLAESSERDRTLTKVIDRIRKSFDLETIFRTTTQEVRSLIKVDRVAVYKFRPDYFGDFIAESEAPGEPKLVGRDRLTAWEDPYLNEHQGGRFRNNEVLVVDDVFNGGLTDCHVEALEGFHVKACIVVAIFKGQELWGLLSAFQNKETRHWEQYEVELMLQVAAQIGVAIQQAEYLQQLQTQSQQLAQAAEKDKAAKELLQQRALQLLKAVRPALDGDLTVRAPITEDELGTIADAYNNTLQALRKIVTQVQIAAKQVAETSSNSGSSIGQLSSQAQQQFQEINKALEEIQQMVHSAQAVAEDARQVEKAVQQANQTVQSGDAAMNRTVEGISEIRETVSQTGKKIKQLSESSQKISKVVQLISNFATQTNVLAMNAAIEATRAGEYGRGFAVVADEVRSLARQSAAATTEIEKLVEEIQGATGEVAAAMETGIQQVVEGTNLVNETRQNLNAIAAATSQISQLVENITEATQIQTNQSVTVTQTMNQVATIANQTSEDSIQISSNFQDLLATAQDLQASAAKFKVN
ncbi:methyl-accepting chemotaxis sensory transducer with GAF sensor [Crinalium epipsammum PCC 9333]|uniref:Methyl-accepting chemotaxis sensory transducer with GAF sensor n=1 Tax=Crinalium epipsammum PCC 9333 TaxID=1173022 RepID=K9W7M0_9CYAN|nr:GAF domain-containing protein [Crinalium epipsammum]AFZ15460.1 methyl-accepting chemotaxis sensory transducer with GAF sensor [Crinalium epipsammum PCC 9333]